MKTKGARIMVVLNTSPFPSARRRDKFIGHTGTILERRSSSEHYLDYYLLIGFDNEELKKDGMNWVWNDDEVIELDNIDYVR